jgi:hypothetical protein
MSRDTKRTDLGAGFSVTPDTVLDRDLKYLEEMHELCLNYKDVNADMYEDALDRALVALDRVNSSLLM